MIYILISAINGCIFGMYKNIHPFIFSLVFILIIYFKEEIYFLYIYLYIYFLKLKGNILKKRKLKNEINKKNIKIKKEKKRRVKKKFLDLKLEKNKFFKRKKLYILDYIPTIFFKDILLFIFSFIIFTLFFIYTDKRNLDFEENLINNKKIYKYIILEKKDGKYKDKYKIYLIHEKGFGEISVKKNEFKKENIKIGKIYSSKLNIEKLNTAFNPNGFDERIYFLSKGNKFKGKVSGKIAEQLDYNLPIYIKYLKFLAKFKEEIIEVFKKNIKSKIPLAVILGDKSEISDKILDSFKRINIYHIISVSGMHISYIAAFLKYFKLNKNSLILFFILFSFSIIVGFSPSVLRAVFILILSDLFDKYNLSIRFIDIFSFVFIINILINPYSVFLGGIYLSFAAYLGIKIQIVLEGSGINIKSEGIKNIFNKFKKFILNSVKISIIIQIIIFPILIYFINNISLNFIIGNLFISAISGLVVMIGFILIIFIFVSSFLSNILKLFSFNIINFCFIEFKEIVYFILSNILNILGLYIENISNILSKLPLSNIYIPRFNLFIYIIYYIFIYFILKSIYLFKRKKAYLILNILK